MKIAIRFSPVTQAWAKPWCLRPAECFFKPLLMVTAKTFAAARVICERYFFRQCFLFMIGLACVHLVAFIIEGRCTRSSTNY